MDILIFVSLRASCWPQFFFSPVGPKFGPYIFQKSEVDLLLNAGAALNAQDKDGLAAGRNRGERPQAARSC